jgi:hypothetical protein
MDAEWSVSRLDRSTPGERATGTHWLWGWVGPTAGLDISEKNILAIPRIELRILGSLARSLVTIPTELSGSMRWCIVIVIIT